MMTWYNWLIVVLPFVGVMDGDRTAVKEAISGCHTPAEYQALMT